MDDLYLSDLLGEEKLLAMILRQAILDIQNEKHRADAWRYFINSDELKPNSFISVCKGLGLDEDKILNRIKNYYLYGKPLARTTYGTSKIAENVTKANLDLKL
jgi:hypothetical protein